MRDEVGLAPPGLLPLFDPAVGDPPADAIELYLEAPLSVGLMFHLAAEDETGDLGHYVPIIDDAREAGVAAALNFASSAEVKVGDHSPGPTGATIGRREPARLYLTRVRHFGVAGHEDTARLHDHLYLGRRAVSTTDSREYPLDLDSFAMVHSIMDSGYRSALQRSLSTAAGVEWSDPVDGERAELVEPPLQECLPDYPRLMCHWHPALAQRWIVGDGRQRRDNPFLLENRRPGEPRPPWDAVDDPYWRTG